MSDQITIQGGGDIVIVEGTSIEVITIAGQEGLPGSPGTQPPLSDQVPDEVSVVDGSPGTGSEAARWDHHHSVATGTPIDIGSSNEEGTSPDLARADHQHKISSDAVVEAFAQVTETVDFNQQSILVGGIGFFKHSLLEYTAVVGVDVGDSAELTLWPSGDLIRGVSNACFKIKVSAIMAHGRFEAISYDAIVLGMRDPSGTHTFTLVQESLQDPDNTGWLISLNTAETTRIAFVCTMNGDSGGANVFASAEFMWAE